MNITQIVFSYPREAQYSYNPASYNGSSIEDVEHVNADVTQGDRILHNGLLWTVAEIQTFSPVGHEHKFQAAITTLDGTVPERDSWDGSPPLFYVHIEKNKCLVWGMAEKPKYLPVVGDAPEEFPEHEVRQFWEFEADQPSASGFNQARICECVPVTARMEAEAIAA
ncbi:MAG: hypothetical protein HC857_01150 [Synechococcales cyanobacterium RU_4_20]|nr:hypothetical protein [Synechococcales cyanobacterium RU_4_20]NJR71137.1 hypothetical protein [Synechococcales cyanobacterium CRU_2_2]